MGINIFMNVTDDRLQYTIARYLDETARLDPLWTHFEVGRSRQ